MDRRKLNRAIKETKAFKEQTPITATVFEMFFKLESHFPKEVKELYLQKEQEQINAKVLEHDKIQREKIAEVTKEVIQSKVLEALEEVDNYCDGKISHFSKVPMDLQGIHATREVKTYLNIIRNRSKT